MGEQERERENAYVYVCVRVRSRVPMTHTPRAVPGRCERSQTWGRVVKGEFYSRRGSDPIPFLSIASLFVSSSIAVVFALRGSTPVEDSGGLRCHQALYVVTAVIATDYVLVRDLLLQRLHTLRGHVVASLHTQRATM